jgi:carotenoid cleavage dioxygenase
MNVHADLRDAPFGHGHGPMLTGTMAPIFKEAVLTDLPVEGEIPEDLNGVYLRNGPNPRFEPKGMHHYFDGDGMLHAGEFRNGRFTYRNKWVRTEGWKKNDETQSENHWGVMLSVKDSPDKPMNDASNTDVIGFRGYAVTNWYLAGTPYLIDPITLETVRSAPEMVSGPGNGMSAHCKVDEHTGELVFFDYFSEAPYMTYGVVNADGELIHHVPVELPGDRLMHDMAMTANYSILHDVPVYHCEEAQKAGRHKILFDSGLPIRFAVIPRKGAPEDVKWFSFSSCFMYHVVNAWDDGDEVVMIACRYMPALNEDGTIDEHRTAKMIGGLEMDARLWRYRMNLKTGETHEECLNTELNIEFPSVNSLYAGRYSKWGYFVDHDPKRLRWTGICKMNTDTGECDGAWTDGHDDCWYGEPWFAPADNATSEDHGYVVTFCWNERTKQQDLQIFDAQNISDGPVARIILPYQLPVGFHSCWMKPSQINDWDRTNT